MAESSKSSYRSSLFRGNQGNIETNVSYNLEPTKSSQSSSYEEQFASYIKSQKSVSYRAGDQKSIFSDGQATTSSCWSLSQLPDNNPLRRIPHSHVEKTLARIPNAPPPKTHKDYPHKFNNREGLPLEQAFQYPASEFPLLKPPRTYTGKAAPGPVRVLYDQNLNPDTTAVAYHPPGDRSGFVQANRRHRSKSKKPQAESTEPTIKPLEEKLPDYIPDSVNKVSEGISALTLNKAAKSVKSKALNKASGGHIALTIEVAADSAKSKALGPVFVQGFIQDKSGWNKQISEICRYMHSPHPQHELECVCRCAKRAFCDQYGLEHPWWDPGRVHEAIEDEQN
ncbi:hypothetical protein TWF506_003151 [Arthrobotrys conoides]|uniref:Uncharacterized protein n=1 Tax=Arthrobotrys conoides TaxID=74498 RepID=A0AAN8RRE5_9PEZI